MSMLGTMKNNLNFTACSQFQPTLLGGQLCYSLNITKNPTGMTETGKRAGLVILIDTGVQNTDEFDSEDINENPLALASSGVDAGSARIYLNTLSSFTDYRAGSYAMTALKKITGTTSFLKQTDEEKKCRIETLEDCQARSYIDRVQEKCGCVPWVLSTALTSKVRPLQLFPLLQFLFKAVQFCSPTASTCYTAVLEETSDCDVSCTGLYADVVFTEDKILHVKTPFSGAVGTIYGTQTFTIRKAGAEQGKERKKLLLLLEKYTDYKNSFVKQIKFHPQLSNLCQYIISRSGQRQGLLYKHCCC